MDDQPLSDALWRIYNRAERPFPWQQGGQQRDGNLPWDDPAFSQRMLREHLDQSHGAASRVTAEREMQLDWFWQKLALQPGSRVLDIACCPTYAQFLVVIHSYPQLIHSYPQIFPIL